MSVQKRRLDRGWSQEELARHSGLSTRTIQRIESGQKPGLESLKCLSAVFETSISTLAQEQSMTKPNDSDSTENVMLMQIERDAIDFAQSILNGRKGGINAPLSKIERQAIDYAKKLIAKFSDSA